ncbi:C2 family cysteine protease [Limnoglobus roseus]|uniref:Calpain catalytic domain-containing protein n=1 Tax=Limnoglobus roseus TaxID=2598579 RepID=A0A5C1ARZ1_9BACT|nr:C2 family cysteine protease [Limnoglobus roseus]QEL20853.1 hypothetical protein PX52LOC_07973 [Limnoglobus roseus]
MTARSVALALGFLVPSLTLAVDAPAAPPTFAEQVKGSFARWDRDHDGTLSREEIDHAVSDPKVKGPEAAAVVALKRAMRSKTAKLPPLTQDATTQFAAAKPAKDQPDLNAMYASALTKITKANRELFAKGTPNLDDLNQGKLGDCFCLAPLGSMVCRDPKDVVKMIRQQKDGSFLVKLGTKDIAVPAPTDAELALTASAGADGLWVNVYEKAIGLVRLEKAKSEGTEKASLIDLLGKGGSAGTMIEVVTGHAIVRFSCKYAKEAATTEKEREAKLVELRKLLTETFAASRLVTCGTATGVTTPGVNGNHAYAVTGYDAKTDEIGLWNPHGQNFTPKGTPGLEHGYPTKDGRFRVPLAQFVRTFAGVAFETPAQVK